MCKLIIKDKKTDEIILSHRLNNLNKAKALEDTLKKYLSPNLVEITIIEKGAKNGIRKN